MKILFNKIQLILIVVIISILAVACQDKKEKSKKFQTPEQEIAVEKELGFSVTHKFPNNTYIPQKEFLDNGDIILHHEVLMKGEIPDENVPYAVTVYTDYYSDIDISYLPIVVTAYSPDSTFKRTQQYKIIFNENKDDRMLEQTNGKRLMRHAHTIFQDIKFPSKGMATFKVEIVPPNAKFSFTGIKAMTVKAEKVESSKK